MKNELRFYVRCKKTDCKIYLTDIPDSSSKALKRSSNFVISCPWCGEEHKYTKDNIFVEYNEYWRAGAVLGVVIGTTISILFGHIYNLTYEQYFILGCIIILMSGVLGSVIGYKKDKKIRKRAKEILEWIKK